MKKYIALALSAALLSGCASQTSTYQTTVDNGSNVVFTADGINVTKQNIYQELMKNYGAKTVLSHALKQIALQENLSQEEIDKGVEAQLTSMQGLLGDSFETYVTTQLGFASLDDFKKLQLEPSVRQTLLLAKYIDEHFDTLLKEYQFIKLQMITVGSEEEATKMISDISSNTATFESLVSKSTNSNTDLGVVFEKSNVDQAILDNLKDFTTNSLYTIPLKLSNGSYGVINIVESDEAKLKEDIKATLKTNTSIASKCEVFYLHKYNFKSLDKQLTEDINAISPQYLGEDK